MKRRDSRAVRSPLRNKRCAHRRPKSFAARPRCRVQTRNQSVAAWAQVPKMVFTRGRGVRLCNPVDVETLSTRCPLGRAGIEPESLLHPIGGRSEGRPGPPLLFSCCLSRRTQFFPCALNAERINPDLPKFARACGRPRVSKGGLKQRRWRAFLVSAGPSKGWRH
jgi:hypothetical protein